jgi:hypothetical protein
MFWVLSEKVVIEIGIPEYGLVPFSTGTILIEPDRHHFALTQRCGFKPHLKVNLAVTEPVFNVVYSLSHRL